MIKIICVFLILFLSSYADGSYEYKSGNILKAIQSFENECKLNISESCNNLAVMYDDGDGVISDKLRAKELYKKACDENNGDACFEYNNLLKKGQLLQIVALFYL